MFGIYIQYLFLSLITAIFLLTFISNYKYETIILKTILFVTTNLFLIFSIKNTKNKSKLINSKGKIWLTIFICFLFLSILWSENKPFGLLKIFQLLLGIIPISIAFSFNKILFAQINWKRITQLLILSLSLLSIIIIFFPPVTFENFRLKTKILSHVFIGRLLIVCIIISLYRLIFENSRTSLNLILFGLISLALNQIALRSGIIATFFVLFFLVIFFQNYKVTIQRLLLTGLIFLLTLIFALNFSQNLLNRIPDFSTYGNKALIFKKDNTIDVRIQALEEGLNMFKASPLWGKGCGSFNSNISLRKDLKYPHNLFVEILSETGILGLLCYLVMFHYLIKHTIKFKLKIKVTLLMIIIYYLILAQFSKDISTNLIVFSLLFFDDKSNSN